MAYSRFTASRVAADLAENKVMNRNYASSPILMILLLQAGITVAADSDRSNDAFFEDKQRGWFWYEVLPEPIKPAKPEPKIEPSKPEPQPVMAKTEESVVVTTPDQPELLSSA